MTPIDSAASGVDRGSEITLREMTPENFRSVLELKVAPDQRGFIATNDRSIAEAHFSDQAWYRAIYADETPVGFVMLADETVGKRENPLCCSLWRFMIDASYQRMGFGSRGLALGVEHVRSHPQATMLITSYVPGNRSAEKFYLKFGFRPHLGPNTTGEIELIYDL
jgi:diamine N-acetyltransferase